MSEEEGKLLDDILDKFYEAKVAKDMGHITGVERWAIERMAAFIIEEGWRPPEEQYELQALITIREGYIAENKQREITGYSMAYGVDHFQELAEMIRALKGRTT
jgi:hypothetical protein